MPDLPYSDLETRILDRLDTGKRKHFLIDKLGSILEAEAGDLRAALTALEDRGDIVTTRKGRIMLSSRLGMLAGTVKVGRRGRAVVVMEYPEEPVAIARGGLRPAMDGDLVLVEVLPYTRRGLRTGSINRILKRGRRSITALSSGHDEHVLLPTDPRIDYLAVLEEGSPAPDPGQVVAVSIVEYPTRHRDLVVRVERNIGPSGTLTTEIESVCHSMGINVEFSPQAEAEARAFTEPTQADIDERLDLRDLDFVTIDPVDARDFDDAIAIQEDDSGFVATVAIADVAHYIRPGTALDDEAYERATSVYFPGRAVHMLPAAISSGLASLKPDLDRLAFTVKLAIDGHGKVSSASFARAVIRSRARLSYEEAQALIDGDTASGGSSATLSTQVEIMARCATAMRHCRHKRGALDFDLPEAQVLLDAEQNPTGIIAKHRLFAHCLIEEFMLAANEAVAAHLRASRASFPYRIHERPKDNEIRRLRERLSLMGLGLKNEGGPLRPRTLQSLLEKAAGGPYARLVSMMVLRALQKARYSAEAAGHFGLASDCYTHFTSPIRRYPDLIVHRALAATLAGKPPTAGLAVVAAHCSEREVRAVDAERDIGRAAAILLMLERTGQRMKGTVSRVERYGYFVQLDEVFVEGFVPVGRLHEYYDYHSKRMELHSRSSNSRIRVGDKATVTVTMAELASRSLELAPAVKP
ncbi:MAG: ribonuclease R [Deltaproteobacteria bacterium]